MKKCPYCAKEIEYSEMYCSQECEVKSEEYYKLRLNWRILMNTIYIISIALIGVGVLFSPTIFSKWGFLGIAVGATAAGVATLIMPTPTDEMIKKHKMKKAQNHMRIYGAVFIVIGVISLITSIIKFCL